jgi:hypothetical protein
MMTWPNLFSCFYLQRMTLETVEELKESEKETVGFAQMPHKHMFVVSQLILDVATSGTTTIALLNFNECKLNFSARIGHLSLFKNHEI